MRFGIKKSSGRVVVLLAFAWALTLVPVSSGAEAPEVYVGCGVTREATPSHLCQDDDRFGAFFQSPTEVRYEVCVEFPTGKELCESDQTGEAGVLYVNEIFATDITGTFNVTWLVAGQQVGSWVFRIPSQVRSPAFGRTATVRPVSGTVLIKRPGPGGFVPLRSISSIPMGTLLDTAGGRVQLTSAASPRGGTQTGQFYSGVFRLGQRQVRSGGQTTGLTVLSLAGGPLRGCERSGAAGARVSARAGGRRLWGDAHGNFQTGGHYASATVAGTKWLTEDSCAGTLVRVVRGVVRVSDRRRHRTVLVKAHHSYLARPEARG